LLAFLRNETREETEYYLITKYGADPSEDIVKLRPKKLRLRAESDGRKSLTLGEYYSEQCEYIHKRGIAPDVAEMMRIGYDSRRKAAVIPWFNADGTVGNVKYRRVDSKVFWYERGGRPIRDMVYGIDVIYRRRIRKACVVEAEIDAMTLMSAGMACVATGGATFTEDKRRLIVQSPLEEIVIVRDNDRAGRRWRNDIYEALRKDVRISFATVPLAAKDPNEYAQAYGVEALRAKMLRRLRHIATLSGVLGDKM
jgi:DNA primase